MEENNSGEIDLMSIFKFIKEAFNNTIFMLFRALNFALRNWAIVVALIVIGFGSGYYSYSKAKTLPVQSAEILVRINFNTVDFIYSEIEVLNNKLFSNDSLFKKKLGVNFEEIEVLNLELVPITNIRDIVDNYGSNGKYLEGLLKNIDLKDEISEVFAAEYKYHTLKVLLSEKGTVKSVLKILDHINNNSFLSEIRDSDISYMNARIEGNIEIIKQIDKVVETYTSKEPITSTSDQIYIVDREFKIDEILQKKINLNREIETYKSLLVYSKNVVVVINDPNISENSLSILDISYITYPIMLVFLFLLLALFRHWFRYFKKLSNKNLKID
tara:strand:- start:20 stop:1006 length:987 start_codon:yes stop_codon:yes gene_type:complete